MDGSKDWVGTWKSVEGGEDREGKGIPPRTPVRRYKEDLQAVLEKAGGKGFRRKRKSMRKASGHITPAGVSSALVITLNLSIVLC